MTLSISSINIQLLISLIEDVGHEMMLLYASNDYKIYEKNDLTPLTEADLLAHHKICNALCSLYPDIPILSEESSNLFNSNNSRSYWAIDPLDGTKEFLNKNGEFTINVALITDEIPVFGLVYAPALNVMYWNDDRNSYKKTDQGITTLSKRVYRFTPELFNEYFKVATSRSHPSIELDIWLSQYTNFQQYSIGSSLKLCQIADQTIDCYPRFGRTCIWDIAASHSILIAISCDIRIIKILLNGNTHSYELQDSITYDPKNIYNDYFLAY